MNFNYKKKVVFKNSFLNKNLKLVKFQINKEKILYNL